MIGCKKAPNKQVVAQKIKSLEASILVRCWLDYAEDEVLQEICGEIEKEQKKAERERNVQQSFWGNDGLFGAAILSQYEDNMEKLEEKKDRLENLLTKRSKEINRIVDSLMTSWDYSYKTTRDISHNDLYENLSKCKTNEDSILVIKDFVANAISLIEEPDLTEFKKISEDHWVTKDLTYNSDGMTNEFLIRRIQDSIVVDFYYPTNTNENKPAEEDLKKILSTTMLILNTVL